MSKEPERKPRRKRTRAGTPEPAQNPAQQRPAGGQRDEVGGSGVYPASSPNAPEDAMAHGEMSWGQGERGEAGYHDHGDSELHLTPEQDREEDEEEAPEKDQERQRRERGQSGEVF